MAMAPSSYLSICIFAIYVVVNSHLAAPASTLVKNVCARTTFPDYCRVRFESRPSSYSADLHKLGDIAIDITTVDASKACDRAQQLMDQMKSKPWLVEKLHKCKEGYRSAYLQLKEASKAWAVNNFAAVRRVVYANFDQVFNCRDALGSYESLMSRNNKDVENMSHITLVICNY